VIVPCSDDALQQAADLLARGGLIAFPTETYYGLGVDPFNPEALQRLFAVKQRSTNKAVLVLVADPAARHLLAASTPPGFATLMARFWPGPLTLVFPALPHISILLTGGTGTVGIRQSSHPLAARVVQQFGGPVTATSANRSAMAPATTAGEVEQVFGNEVDLVLDGGTTPGGPGSTLVGYEHALSCVREGKISFSAVRKVLEDEHHDSRDR
jgi:L-threonylcarbamoyladenylate synthase